MTHNHDHDESSLSDAQLDAHIEAMLELLIEIGPTWVNEWVDAYVERSGTDRSEVYEVMDQTLFDPRVVQIESHLLAHGARVYAGMEFAHRLTAAEIEAGSVGNQPDWWFAPIVGAVDAGFALGTTHWAGLGNPLAGLAADGQGVDVSRFVFANPDELKRFAPGDLVGMRWDKGQLALSAWEREPDAAADAAFVELFEVHIDPGFQMHLGELLGHCAAVHPAEVAGVTGPIVEVLAAAGFTYSDDGLVRRAADSEDAPEIGVFEDAEDFDEDDDGLYDVDEDDDEFDEYDDDSLDLQFDRDLTLVGRLFLSYAKALALEVDVDFPIEELVPVAWRKLPEEVGPIRIAAAVDGVTPEGVMHAAEVMLVHAPPYARPALEYLAGVGAEWAGDIAKAERHWEKAADGDFLEGLDALLQLNFTRGDYVRALSLWRRAFDEDPNFAHFAEPTGPELGRNERCWCGSGRKYKACHYGKPGEFALGVRSPLVLEKVLDVNRDPRFAMVFFALVQQVDGREAFSPEFLYQFGVFEVGGIDVFFEGLGQLLPADEAALLEQWAAVDRALYEVESVGEQVVLRDVRTGDRFETRVWGTSTTPAPLSYLTAILLPDAAGGFLPVAVFPVLPTAVEELLAHLEVKPVLAGLEQLDSGNLEGDDDAEDLVLPLAVHRAAWLLELLTLLAPPSGNIAMVTKDGSPLAPTEVELTTTAPARFRKLLTKLFEREDEDSDHWLVLDEARSIRGSIAGPDPGEGKGRFHLESISSAWIDDILDELLEAEPGLVVGEITQSGWQPPSIPVGTSPEDVFGGGNLVGGNPEDMPDEVREMMTEVIAKHEASWVDENIAALGNRTPRECVADPTRRDDVIRLLATFGETENPLQMSPNRLRALLGLPRVNPSGSLGLAFGGPGA